MQATTLVLALHILAALWMAGGAFGSTVVRAQTKRASDAEQRSFGLRLRWRLHAIFTLPGLLLAGPLGLSLLTAGGYRMAELWVKTSVFVWLAMTLSSLALLTPALRRAAEATGEEAERLAAAPLPGILSDLNALGIVVLTALMVFKP